MKLMDQEYIQIKLESINYIYRLDRSYCNLVQFQRKLNSYPYEPNTYNQYETRAILLQKLTVLLKGHLDVLSNLKHRLLNSKQGLCTAKYQLSEAKVLDEGIHDYISEHNFYAEKIND